MLTKIIKPSYIVGTITSIALLLLGLAILGISLISANRHQAAGINAISIPQTQGF